MLVPRRVEAAALLLSLDPPPWHLRHSRAVAEVAAFLADRAVRAGAALDPLLAETAALLHDADKALPPGAPEKRLRHGEGSAAWLAARGFPALGPLVAHHAVTRLADDGPAEAWLRNAEPEALVVAYADKRAMQRLVPMQSRFADWTRRYPLARNGSTSHHDWDEAILERVRTRALALEERVCALAGVRPDEVRRLPWTAAALARARRGPGATPGRGAARGGQP